MMKQNKRLIGIIIIVIILLLVPLIAMEFTDEVNWTLFDFVVAGFLLLSFGLLFELAMRKVKKINHRIAVCGVILTVLVIIWIELAVGIFGTPFAGS